MMKEHRLHALKRQVERLRRRLGRLEEANDRASWFRLLSFAAGVALSGIFFFLGYLWLFGLGLLATIVAFGVAVVYHRRIGRAMNRFRIMTAIKERQIARMGLDWDGLPPSDDRPENPLELDFDLVGETSLMRLVGHGGLGRRQRSPARLAGRAGNRRRFNHGPPATGPRVGPFIPVSNPADFERPPDLRRGGTLAAGSVVGLAGKAAGGRLAAQLADPVKPAGRSQYHLLSAPIYWTWGRRYGRRPS